MHDNEPIRPSLSPYRPVVFDDLIRLGRDHDGGYLLPRRVVVAAGALLSMGVNDDWSFEEDALAINPALRVTCVDSRTGLGHIVRKTLQKGVDLIGALLAFRGEKIRRNAHYVATRIGSFRRFFGRHELRRLTVAATPGPGRVTVPDLLGSIAGDWLLVKCDIEGGEYDVLPPAAGQWQRVAALLVEFHGLGANWSRFTGCMRTLSGDFVVAHVHGNNFVGCIPGTSVPDTIEVTLVNRRLVDGVPAPSLASYPLPGLDMPCSRKRPDLPLSFD